MTPAPFQVSIDANDPRTLGAFWQRVLPHYVEQPPPPGHDTWEAFAVAFDLPPEDIERFYSLVDPSGAGPRLLFQQVPEAKTSKNRFHLDVPVGPPGEHPPFEAVQARAAELVEAGATLVDERKDRMSRWIVLQDPEGNEFCVQ